MLIGEKGYETYFVDVQFKSTLFGWFKALLKMKNFSPFYLILQRGITGMSHMVSEQATTMDP